MEAASIALILDMTRPWIWDQLSARVQQSDGTVTWEQSVEVNVPGRSSELLELPPEATTPDYARAEVLSTELESVRALHFFAEDIHLSYDPDPIRITVEPHSRGCRIIVTARSLARDVTVLADRLAPEAVASTGLLTLRAGEQVTIDVLADGPVVVGGMDVSSVVRCANDLMHAPQHTANESHDAGTAQPSGLE